MKGPMKGPNKGPMKGPMKGGDGPMKGPVKGPVKGPMKVPPPPQFNGPRARALYDYDTTAPDELSFSAGTVINVLKQDPSGWWEGEINGKTGWIPATYCEMI